MTHLQATQRVFLLEDNPDDRQFLDIATRRAGLQIDWQWCDSCAAGRDLLAEIASEQAPAPDIVILDLRLGDGFGTELIPQIRQILPPELPVVIFSTSSSEHDRASVADEPNLSYLVKPQSLSGFDEIINAITGAGTANRR